MINQAVRSRLAEMSRDLVNQLAIKDFRLPLCQEPEIGEATPLFIKGFDDLGGTLAKPDNFRESSDEIIQAWIATSGPLKEKEIALAATEQDPSNPFERALWKVYYGPMTARPFQESILEIFRPFYETVLSRVGIPWSNIIGHTMDQLQGEKPFEAPVSFESLGDIPSKEAIDGIYARLHREFDETHPGSHWGVYEGKSDSKVCTSFVRGFDDYGLVLARPRAFAQLPRELFRLWIESSQRIKESQIEHARNGEEGSFEQRGVIYACRRFYLSVATVRAMAEEKLTG